MAVSPNFRSYVEDQLRGTPGLVFRPMFGELGIYADGQFFAVLADDVLYFKVDRTTAAAYRAEGSRAFSPVPGKTSMSYYEVPPRVLEDRDELHRWLGQALDVARRGQKRAKRNSKSSRGSAGGEDA